MSRGDGRRLTTMVGRFLAGGCMAALALTALPVKAQDGTGDQQVADTSESGLGDIVVTARYVAENIQDTPIAITAQTGAELKAANVTDIGTLGAVVPNLQTVPGDSQSAGTPRVSLRGVQQGSSSSIAVPPAVAIYTDDIYHSTTAGSEIDLTDVALVEVNRGPQSTLSGNASIGGSIKIVTQDPRGDGSGYVSLGYGARDRIEAAGAIDLGLSDTLAVRAFGHFNRQRGFGNLLDFSCMMDRQGTPERKGTLPYFRPGSANNGCVFGHQGGGTTAVGQVKLLWKPTDDIQLLLTARHREEDLEATPEVILEYPAGCVGPVPGYPDGIGPQPCTTSGGNQVYHLATYNTFGIVLNNSFLVPRRSGGIYDSYYTACRPLLDKSGVVGTSAFPPGYPDGFCNTLGVTAHHTQFSGKLTARLAEAVNMTAIVGRTDYANEFSKGSDLSPLSVGSANFINEDEMWSGELRFDGKLFEDRLQWVLGGFWMRTEGTQNNFLAGTNTYSTSVVLGINKSRSVFTHLDFNITDAWRISGGARYSDTDIAITIDNPRQVSVLVPVVSSQNRVDWLISTDYRITDDIMAYASAATGSRPAGLTTILTTPRQLAPTPDEELISYEAGIKADLLDRRLRTNLTAFYMDYKKLSTGVTGIECRNQPGDVATWYNLTAGTAAATAACAIYPGTPDPIAWNQSIGIPATVKGFEWEISALPIDGLRINWTGGFNRFRSKVAPPAPGSLYPGNHRQPEWNMHADISYDLETEAGTFTPRLDWSWQSQQDFDPLSNQHAPEELFIIHPYSLWNAQLVYRAPSRDWSATLSVTNLADKWYHYQVLRGSFATSTRVAAPREWLLTIRKEF